MTFTVEYLEYALLVFVRVASIMVTAPLFNNSSVPRKVKAGLSIFLALMLINTIDYTHISYDGIIGYSTLVLKEAITGLLIGIGSGFCLYILHFSGTMVDMEIGFSMAMTFDPSTSVQTTITSTLFNYIFLLLFLVSDMHYYVIDALFDSYKLIPIGGAVLNGNLLKVFTIYIVDYFIIGFRIILPVFSCILVLDVILGILAKVAPQMNMFVIGMQLKVFIGLFLLFIVITMFPSVTQFLFQEMQKMTDMYIKAMAP